MEHPPNRHPSECAAAQDHTTPAEVRARTANPSGSNRGIEKGHCDAQDRAARWREPWLRRRDQALGIVETGFPAVPVDRLQREDLAPRKPDRERDGDELCRRKGSVGPPRLRHVRTGPRSARAVNLVGQECRGDESRRMVRAFQTPVAFPYSILPSNPGRTSVCWPVYPRNVARYIPPHIIISRTSRFGPSIPRPSLRLLM